MISDMDEDLKRKEYLKQQLRLKTRTKGGVVMSADDMIESLLSKKEIFRKKTESDSTQNSKIVKTMHGSDVPMQIPLFGGKPLPPLYLEVWDCVKGSDGLADTSRVSTLLMTSGLTPQTLAYIWALANRTVAGYLTQTELFTTLALVSLAQSGYSFTSSAVVNQLREPPIPRLDLRVIQQQQLQSTVCTTVSSSGLLHLKPTFFPNTTDILPNNPLATTITPTLSQALSSTNGLLFPGASLPTFQPPPPLPVNFEDSQGHHVPSPSSALSLLPSNIPTVAQTLSSSNHLTSLDTMCTALSTITPSATGPQRLSTLSASDLELISSSSQILSTPLDPVFGDFQSSLCPTGNQSESPPLPCPDSLCIIPSSSSNEDDEFDDFKSAELPPTLEASVPGTSSSSGSALVEDLFLPLATTSTAKDLLNLFDAGSNNIKKETETTAWLSEENDGVGVVPCEDRYSALRSLAEDNENALVEPTKSRTSSIADEFGDFIDASVPEQSPFPTVSALDTSRSIQEKCIEACMRVLQSGLSILESIAKDVSLVTEITTSTQGSSYLQDLVEVLRLCERLIRAAPLLENVSEITGNCSQDSSQCKVTNADIDDKTEAESRPIIRRLENVVLPQLKTHLAKVIDMHMEEEDGPVCGVCLQSRGPAHIRYGLNSFHAPCANFYLNCVDNQLPIAPNIALKTS